MTARGVFITFEGGEGCGKSTQISMLEGVLRSAGLDVVTMREPGGTRLGEMVRSLLLDPAHGEVEPRAELLLYEACRAQLVVERILPALALGSVVLCDRFYDSTTAYQGHGRGLRLDEIDELNSVATGGLTPDLTVLLDIDTVTGLARATRDGADRLESAGTEFHERVREGFLAIAAGEPLRFAVVDGTPAPDAVHAEVLAAVRRVPVIELALTEAGL